MSLRDDIQTAQKQAMKDRQEERLSTLRLLWSQIKNVEIDKKHELNDEEIQSVVATQVKQLKDALKDFTAGGRADLVTKAEKEIVLLESYLPVQLADEQLQAIVEKVLKENNITTAKDIGRAVGVVMKEVKGQANGNRVKEMVTKILGQ